MFSTEIEKFIQAKKYLRFSPKAVFFDMDGVLYDSMKSHTSAWTKALRSVGLPFTEYEAYMNEGRTGASTIDGVFMKVYGREATEDEKQTIYAIKSEFFEACNETLPMPKVFDLLKKVKEQKLDIFVVTGSAQPTLIDGLDSSFPGIFIRTKMVTAFDVHYCKPHPEPYLTALKKSGLQPWEVLVIENAPLGVESATAAGLFTIAVNTGPLDPQILHESGANLVFDNMNDLYKNWNAFSSNWQ